MKGYMLHGHKIQHDTFQTWQHGFDTYFGVPLCITLVYFGVPMACPIHVSRYGHAMILERPCFLGYHHNVSCVRVQNSYR